MGALRAPGPEDGAHGTALGAAVHGNTSPDLFDASGTSRGSEDDTRILPLAVGGRYARRPAFPVERKNALRQDFHHLPASEEAGRKTRVGADLQTCGRRRLADRSRIPC